jgi:lysophospholipase L1-like esterase
MAAAARAFWFHRHPTLMAVLLLLITTIATLTVLELVVRAFVKYHPGYYTASEGEHGVLVYPFGEIIYNSLGFPDSEFLLEAPGKRVGYVGDSVTRGVGAGYGYRITEVLEEYYPNMQHMNLNMGVGIGMDRANIGRWLQLSDQLGLDVVVYLMNLNDILPDQAGDGEESVSTTSPYRRVKKWLRQADILRGRSYLYTAARNGLKDLLMRNGIGVNGVSYEFDPHRYADVITQTAQRIRLLAESLEDRGVEFIVVIIPYEMQISEDAERIYRELGIEVSREFVERATQRALQGALPDIRTIDAAAAFLDEDGGRPAKVGEYFVYDRGGRLDWNHPTRAGHRRIAEFLVEEGLLPAGAE